MSRRYLLSALVVSMLCAAAWSQAPGPRNRSIYVVKKGSAKDLATVLNKHFQGDAEVIADPSGNYLLVSAAPNVFDQVMKQLGQLDRRPRMIAVEVLIADVVKKKPERAEPDDKDLDERELTGSIPDVMSRLEAMKKKGRFSGLKRIQVAAVEGVPSSSAMLEMKPHTVGAGGVGGKTSRQINYRDTGTMVKLTPRVLGDKTVQLDLNVSDSRMHVPENGIKIGVDENGAPIFATEFVSAQLTTTLSIPSGQAVAATGTKTSSSGGQAQTLIIVAARIEEPGGK